jgi:glucan 1,3-beta-glucosidase
MKLRGKLQLLVCCLGWLASFDSAMADGSSPHADPSSSWGNVDPTNNDSVVFRHFVAHHSSMTCTPDGEARLFNNQIRGVNLGGWMVLEPWITPSLFYQFLGGGVNSTAFDMYTFCEVLGPKEANRQLRRHWDAWVTEDIIKELKDSGAVNSLRLPIGDFMYVPYGPYADGCVEGALERVDQLLDWAYASGLTVLLDIHTMKGSQNGFDNSGQSMGFAWTSGCK